jgi:hypothetical protein
MTAIYRGSNLPLFIAGSFLLRAQSFSVNQNQEVTPIRELAGTAVGPRIARLRYDAQIRAYEVGQNILGALGLTTSLQDYLTGDPAGVTVGCAAGGLTAAILTGLEYTLQVNQGAVLTCSLLGQGWTTVGTATPAIDLTKPAAIMSWDCAVDMGSVVQRVVLRVNLPTQVIFERGVSTPVGYLLGAPDVTLDIETVHAGTCTWLADETAQQDITLTIGSAQTVVVKDCVSQGQPVQGAVRGWVTHTYRYRSCSQNFTLS